MRRRQYSAELEAEARRLYVEVGQSCALIARQLGVSKGGIASCLRRQGVQLRDTRIAVLLAISQRDEKAVRPPREPKLCKCGCGQLTTGYARRAGPGDEWKYPEYVAGHFRHTEETMPLRDLKFDYSGLRCAAWVKSLEEARKRKGWSLTRLTSETGVPYQAVVYADRPLPERVVICARAVGLDPQSSLIKAGHPKPSRLGWAMIEALAKGQTRQGIKVHSGVNLTIIHECLTEPEKPVSEAAVRKLARVLKLSRNQVREILIEMALLRKVGGGPPLELDDRQVAAQIKKGGITEGSARALGISLSTLHFRAVNLGLTTGLSRAEYQTEYRKKRQRHTRTAPARAEHTALAAKRRTAAREWLRGQGPAVLTIGYRTVQEMFGIRRDVAIEETRQAKEAIRSSGRMSN